MNERVKRLNEIAIYQMRVLSGTDDRVDDIAREALRTRG